MKVNDANSRIWIRDPDPLVPLVRGMDPHQIVMDPQHCSLSPYLFVVSDVAAGGNTVDSGNAGGAGGLGRLGQVLPGHLLREPGRVPQLFVLVFVRQGVVIIAHARRNARLGKHKRIVRGIIYILTI